MPAIELGGRFAGIVLDEAERVAIASYDLVIASGESLGHAGEVRIPFETLDTIDRRLGGKKPLTGAQRINLVGKLVLPMFVLRFSRTEIPPPASPAPELEPEEPPPPTQPEGPPKDAFVSAHGAIVPAGVFVPTIKGA